MTGGIFKQLYVIAMASFILAACTAFNPAAIQPERVFRNGSEPLLEPGQKVKIMSWNVQYMAGKNYMFFYDLLDGSGPDRRPSAEDITSTLKEAALVIRRENPDIVMLQEVDDNARRTDYEDQLARLLELLPADFKFHASAFYWQSSFVPHPKIMC